MFKHSRLAFAFDFLPTPIRLAGMSEGVLCSALSLNLERTLLGGQSFTWVQCSANSFAKVFNSTIITVCERSDGNIVYSPYSASNQSSLVKYFNLDIDLDNLYKAWSIDTNFAKKRIQGIRLLNQGMAASLIALQDPVENAFSFICTSNNNIGRITGMVTNMSRRYGQSCGTIWNELTNLNQEMFSFPSVDSLSQPDVESTLRELGFGYRAKYIHKSALYIQEKGGDGWLESLKDLSSQNARLELMNLVGVGPKVAGISFDITIDCILLMSTNKLDTIPIDTHVWQIAVRDYGFKNSKTLTKDSYGKVSVLFQEIFGSHAGWAHTVLFVADLRQTIKAERLKKRVREE